MFKSLQTVSRHSWQLLATAFFIVCFLIYLPLLGRAAETQPVLALLVAGVAITSLLVRACYTRRLSIFVAGILVFATFIGFHSLFLAEIVRWTELPRFLIGPLFFAASIYLAPYFGVTALRFALAFMVIGGLLEVFAPSVYETLNVYISADRPGNAVLSLRGLRYFAPEPTYAVLSVFLAIVLNYFLHRRNKISTSAYVGHWVVALSLLIMTYSSYGALILFIFGFAYIVRGKNVALTVSALVLTPLLVVLVYNSETRAGELLQNLSKVNPGNLVQTFFLAEPSFSTRILRFAAGIQGLITNPWGYGIGSYQAIYWQHFNELGWDWVRLHEVIGEAYLNRDALQPDSYLTALLHDLGVFGLSAFLLFLWRIRQAFGRTPTEAWIFLTACFMLTVQAQLTNPVPWVSLGLMYALNRQVVAEGSSRQTAKPPSNRQTYQPSTTIRLGRRRLSS